MAEELMKPGVKEELLKGDIDYLKKKVKDFNEAVNDCSLIRMLYFFSDVDEIKMAIYDRLDRLREKRIITEEEYNRARITIYEEAQKRLSFNEIEKKCICKEVK